MRNATPRLSRARVTLPLLGLLGLAVAAGSFAQNAGEIDEATALVMASERGILPLIDWPEKGTEIFQWDPELKELAPFYIGKVTDPDFHDRDRRYALVKRPHAKGLAIVVEPHALRYWVRKTKR